MKIQQPSYVYERKGMQNISYSVLLLWSSSISYIDFASSSEKENAYINLFYMNL